PLSSLGFQVMRADDIHQAGGITEDVVRLIAESALVLADLTDLNANVFYELGVRHVLRKFGTIMIIDETRTEIPFDLAQYRVIKYEPTLRGAEIVRNRIAEYADNFRNFDGSTSDNPVHVFLPSLPVNVLHQASGSVEGELRQELGILQRRITHY